KNPHPNWLVGGVPSAIGIDGEAGAPINMERLNLARSIIDQAIDFVEQVYIPDLLAIASFYKEWLHGGGLSSRYLMSYGDIPEHANDYSAGNLLLPRGAILDGNLNEVHDVDIKDREQIKEYVTHSWYKYPDENLGLHPFDGVTEPNFVLGPNAKGDKKKLEAVDEGAKYSWVKAPRYKGHAMEVGPLARFVIGYAKGIAEFKEPVEAVLKQLDVPVTALFSTLGRTAARGLECQWAAHKLSEFQKKLVASIKAGDTSTANTEKWDPKTWPARAEGAGFSEAPRGALGHWVRIENGKIANYHAVVPTTWNASPRDPEGKIGAYEAALLGTPMADPEQPLEILRTIHSFDPCLACATHVMAPDGRVLTEVKVR
ncbi:MAG: nickel-dependent hydrogenase large subunit, partial [Myxococcales bacterium]|nr:nickel-dependent hydrogenase large subunit [Myxococcales bacterium]